MKHLMIPARVASRRVPRKNVRPFCGRTLLEIAIQKALDAGTFEVVVNSPDAEILEMSTKMGVKTYHRPSFLDSPSTTNQDFLQDYVKSNNLWHSKIYMLNTTSPLLSVESLVRFASFVDTHADCSTVFSVVGQKAPFILNGSPVNFCYDHHIPSEYLAPLKRITWGITAWEAYNFRKEGCGIYAGKVGYFEIPHIEGIDVDTEEDWNIAKVLYGDKYGYYKPWSGFSNELGGE